MSNWTCPYCQHAQTLTSPKYQEGASDLYIRGLAEGLIGIDWVAIGCANENCRRLTLSVFLHGRKDNMNGSSYKLNDSEIMRWDLLPESQAKPQPLYIPAPLIEDYGEACRIQSLSPKASATLARRCLQGMIRDFCGISKARLIDEVNELRRRVDDGNAPAGVNIEAIEAIDQVRGIGNIGAHMEKDINLIVPVDAEEAQLLIQLIEMLFEEWYVARHNRQQRLARIASLSEDKKAIIANGRAAQNALVPPSLNAPDPA